ncbi:ABC transporter permease [Arhodomonas sp. SL1]|uniref:ABC transporter permease n=1 Tax=Arhodomonas sp. SL1 TaxID=3425691 RepID=UPI003F884DD2
MRTLRRKLLRDLIRLGAQTTAIAVVIGAGVMTLILSVTSLEAMERSRGAFYRDQALADVFVTLKRAPEAVAERLVAVPGVNRVETRIRAPVRLQIPGFGEPVRGLALSIPDGRQPAVNRLHLREGGLPEPGRRDQVVLSEAFAEAHGLHPGDRITAIIRGRLEALRVSGVALSPEFVYQVGPADLLPDYRRYGVLWMGRSALAGAYGMEGAFNDVVLTLQARARVEAVVARVDAVLGRYGGTGAHGRDELPSERFLAEEIDQLRGMALVLPAVFLGVSAFLLSVLMARVIRTQRREIALLKAFGYRDWDIAVHYALMTAVVVGMGGILGAAFGAWAAEALGGLYREYFRFPNIDFRLSPRVVGIAVLVAGGAGAVGTFGAVRAAARLRPAEAMRPPLPERFHRGRLAGSRLGRRLDQPTRVVLRHLARHRLKAALSVLGIGLSAALLLLGSYQFAAVERLIDVQYRLVQKADVQVVFSEVTSVQALADLRHQPGVWFAEGYRSVPVRLRHGRRHYTTSILGMDRRPQLRGLIDAQHRPLTLPAQGLLLTDYLADQLGVAVGESLSVEILEGRRETVRVPIAAVVAEPVGVGVYMARDAVNRLMREGPAVSGAWLLTDRHREAELFDALWAAPRIAGVGLLRRSEAAIRDYIEGTMLVTMGLLLVLAGCITFAVVYNNARIAFAERGRELATLRVLGFTHGEVAWILAGEIALITLLAIPVGWLLGTGFAWLLNVALSMELMRLPFVITPTVYAFAAAGVLGASALSVLLVVRWIRRLDMVSALKTGE